MPMLSNSPNHFLASLSPTDADLLRPHLRPLTLPQGAFIYKAEDLIERVYFPHTGVISLIVGLTSGQFVEAGSLVARRIDAGILSTAQSRSTRPLPRWGARGSRSKPAY